MSDAEASDEWKLVDASNEWKLTMKKAEEWKLKLLYDKVAEKIQ